jgi:serine/threonine-protein kinase RsbT
MGLSPPSFTLPVSREEDRFACAVEAMRIARWAGLSERAQQELAIAVAELVSNAVRHAGGGEIELRAIPGEDPPEPGRGRWGVQVVVRDSGPGMSPSLAGATPPGATPPGPRLPGQGLGLGLGAVQRLMSSVEIRSNPGVRTEVIAEKWGDAPVPWRVPL